MLQACLRRVQGTRLRAQVLGTRLRHKSQVQISGTSLRHRKTITEKQTSKMESKIELNNMSTTAIHAPSLALTIVSILPIHLSTNTVPTIYSLILSMTLNHSQKKQTPNRGSVFMTGINKTFYNPYQYPSNSYPPTARPTTRCLILRHFTNIYSIDWQRRSLRFLRKSSKLATRYHEAIHRLLRQYWQWQR